MANEDAFTKARGCFEEMLGFLGGSESAQLSHADLEDEIVRRGRETQRLAFQDHLDLRALRERRTEVVDAHGVAHRAVEAGHARQLHTVVGAVGVERLAYRHVASANLHPADAALNLPDQLHSHGLRRLAAIESTRGSFDEASQAVHRATGVAVAKRQVEDLTSRATRDVEAFYETREHTEVDESDALVISADGKGIVMRPDSLREATAKAAAAATNKLTTRLSKGEKANRKRMAEVGAVYDVTPVPRTPHQVMASKANEEHPPEAPKAKNKWLTASVVEDAAEVVRRLFDEADRRDPAHTRRWVALVDGNNHQIDRIGAEATLRGIDVTIVVDLVHVLDYLCPHCPPILPCRSLGPDASHIPRNHWVIAPQALPRLLAGGDLDRMRDASWSIGRRGTGCARASPWRAIAAGTGSSAFRRSPPDPRRRQQSRLQAFDVG